MKDVERALWVIEKTREIGRMDAKILGRFPDWDRIKAHRYLTCLARLGWLERVGESKAIYVLGRKVMAMAPELRF